MYKAHTLGHARDDDAFLRILPDLEVLVVRAQQVVDCIDIKAAHVVIQTIMIRQLVTGLEQRSLTFLTVQLNVGALEGELGIGPRLRHVLKQTLHRTWHHALLPWLGLAQHRVRLAG